MFETIIDHFDAIILFNQDSGDVVLRNHEFKELFNDKIKSFQDLEEFFIKYYDSAQLPILNTIKIDDKTYIVKRKIIEKENLILYHFEDNNYYVNVIDNIKKQAIIDELTGCYNKKEFENIFKRMLSSAHRYTGSNFAAIMLDIDHFKEVNDTYGHLAGDFILKQMSIIIHEELRDSDIFARVGGEEFVILLPQTKLNGALKTAQKIRKSIEMHEFDFNSQIINITASLGITSTISNDTYFSILDRIDKALYKAKDEGRNRVEYI